jgi:polar amino acid transport system substrate-binding protein
MKWILLVFLFPSSFAQAAPLPCLGIYKVALNESEPLYFRDWQAQRYVGASLDVVEQLAKRTSCQFNTVAMNRSRLVNEMKSYRMDLVVVTVRNETFDGIAKFVPLESVHREAVISADKGFRYKSFQDLLNDREIHFVILPAVTIFFTKEEVAKLYREGRFTTATSLQNSYELLKRTKNMAIVQTDWVNQYFQKTMDMQSKFIRIKDDAKTFEIGIYNRSNISAADMKSITKALDDMVVDGTWKKIKDRYANFRIPEKTKK